MADKLTVAEAIELANQTTAELTNEQLTQMNEAFKESFLNQQARQPNEQIASDVTIAEIDARLKALAENKNPYDEKDLDSIIAMAESVGMFSQNSEVAKEVLDKAKAQKEALQSKAQENEQTKTEENTAESNTAEENTATPDLKDQIEIENTSSENQSDSDTLTVEEGQALETLENTPEDQAELDKFDKENGIDTVTQEQLEANDNILDIIPHPLATDKQGNLINPQFEEELKALQNLTITDNKDKELSESQQKAARMDLISAALLEAKNQTRVQGNENPEEVKKLYYDNFKDALQRNIVSAVFASEINKGMTQEQLQEKFAQAVQNPQKATLSSVSAVMANTLAHSDKMVDRLKAKLKTIPIVQKIENNVKAFDIKMTERYGKKYETAKRVAKVLGNVGVYTAIGALAGTYAPAVFAGLAVKSAYDSTKMMQKKAKMENMSFKDYKKKHKAEVYLAYTSTAISIALSGMGVANMFGVGASNAAVEAGKAAIEETGKSGLKEIIKSIDMQSVLKWTARGLAVGKNAIPTAWYLGKYVWKKYVKKDEKASQKAMSMAKSYWKETLISAIGIGAGTYAADFMSEHMPNKPEENTSDNSNNTSNNANNASNNVIDRDNDGIPDTIDRDGGAGWANVDDREVNLQNTQHDNQENRGQPDNQENRDNSNPRVSNEPEQTAPFDLKKMEGVGFSQAQVNIPQEINDIEMPVHPSTEGLDMPTHQEIHDIVTELKQQYEQTGKIDLAGMMREQYANGDISEAKLKAITTIFNDVYDAKGNDVLATLDHIDKEASQAAEEERAAVLEAAQHPIINDKANEETIVSESSLSMDSKVGAIDYTIDSNGNYTIDGGNMSATGDYEAHQALTENILKNNPNLTLEDAQVQANKVILENQICSDLESRVANGEAIPGAEKFIEDYNTSLRESGFMRDQDGNIVELNTQEKTAENSQTNTEEKTAEPKAEEKAAEPKAEEKTSEQKALEEKVNRFVDEKVKSGELDASKAEEMKDKLIKEVSQPEEKNQEVNEQQQENTKEDNDIVEHAKINYSLDEDGYLRSVNAQYSIDKNNETYETISNNLAAYRENNRFSFADLSMPRSADQLLIYNEVYSDIKEGLDKGENIPGAEKFIKQYEQNLQKLGLARDEDGNIVKANANSGKQMEQAVINAALQQNRCR